MMALGYWSQDAAGLPCFVYTGALPYSEFLENGNPVKLPDDPWFLLGNHRLTLFTHVSGVYELIAGQRSWARVNAGDKPNSGNNAAFVTVNGREYALVGIDALAAHPDVCSRV